jgi:uroporphyrinogen-III synthase
MMNLPHPLTFWIPRTTVTEAPSRLVLGLMQAGHCVLEQAWQHIEATPQMQDGATPTPHEWIMFTSPLGVSFFHQWLKQHQTPLSPTARIMVLGEGTAHAFEKTFHRKADFIPQETKHAHHLITEWLKRYSAIPPVHILWPCSQLSHALPLYPLLQEAGHTLHPWPLYHPTPLPKLQQVALLEEATSAHPDMGVLTSPSNIERLQQAQAFERFPRLPWCTLGPSSTQALARIAPHVNAIELKTATADGLLQACKHWR